jgi:hypothetical protein
MSNEIKITLNQKILSTLSVLSKSGFACSNLNDLELFKSFNHKESYEKNLTELTFNHVEPNLFAYIKINYKNSFTNAKIKDVKILVKDINNQFSKPKYTLLKVDDSLSKQIKEKISRIHRIEKSIVEIEEESKNRFPIVKKELENIFGLNTTIERNESHGISVVYKNIRMLFSLYTTKLNINKEYKTLITFGKHNQEVSANNAKELIDLS